MDKPAQVIIALISISVVVLGGYIVMEQEDTFYHELFHKQVCDHYGFTSEMVVEFGHGYVEYDRNEVNLSQHDEDMMYSLHLQNEMVSYNINRVIFATCFVGMCICLSIVLSKILINKIQL